MHPTDIMQALITALDPVEGMPQPDKYYTYIYNAKTLILLRSASVGACIQCRTEGFTALVYTGG